MKTQKILIYFQQLTLLEKLMKKIKLLPVRLKMKVQILLELLILLQNNF